MLSVLEILSLFPPQRHHHVSAFLVLVVGSFFTSQCFRERLNSTVRPDNVII